MVSVPGMAQQAALRNPIILQRLKRGAGAAQAGIIAEFSLSVQEKSQGSPAPLQPWAHPLTLRERFQPAQPVPLPPPSFPLSVCRAQVPDGPSLEQAHPQE